MSEQTQELVKNLQARNQKLFQASDQALHWFEDNPQAVKGDTESLKVTLRRFRRQAKQLNRASHQPPAIAVFGASQAGKSYLVSGLATKTGEELLAYYKNETLNFLKDMNPQGGNESTGLVSRFTTHEVTTIQDEMPVPLRLLSAVDVVKILTNSSLEDFKVKESAIDSEKVNALFQSVNIDPDRHHKNKIIDIDAVEELWEYLQATYPDHHRWEEIGDAYWKRLKETAPYISATECASLFSPLWNGLSQFTDLARSLFIVLEQLGNADIAYAATDALKPREKSILNVETLFGLGQGSNDMINILTPESKTVQVDRATVTALTAEITVPIGEAPWSFLNETDLLDFPGARSREMIYDPQVFLEAPESLGRLFLRGKVAYLFQRYELEREISAMLLCIGDSIQNVSTLPGMIDGWIKNSIGETPEERAQQRNNLFVVLTKFDREFEQKQGDSPSSGARWTARINASLLDFFKASSWIDDWKDNQPFNNVYWLRSPSISFPAVMDYETINGHRRETGIAEKSKLLVTTMQESYLSNAEIQRYVANPLQAWDAVLELNDGGITYLANALQQVCDVKLKVEQISVQTDHLSINLARFIHPYYHSGNKEEAIQKATLEAQNIARSLMKSVAAQMFGPLLRSLQVTRDQMMVVWYVLETQTTDQQFIIGRTSDVDSLFQDMFPDADEDNSENAGQDIQSSVRDRHEQYADLALERWNNMMDSFARNEHTTKNYQISSEQLTALTAEIGVLARRLNLRDILANKLRQNASIPGAIALSGETQALLAEIEIGNFVNWLGYIDIALEERPMTRGLKGEHIFTPRESPKGILELPEQPIPYNERFVRDWISALVQRFQENAGSLDMEGFDPAANDLLGRIISVLEQNKS